jgi:hypothetical protein
LIIALDFDGTCVTHEYPVVGQDIGAVPILKELIKNGHKIILWTMRDGNELEDAVDWFASKEIPLFGINRNPEQDEWTSSPKAYAQQYIDDASICCPLVYQGYDRPYVDWSAIKEMLQRKGMIA